MNYKNIRYIVHPDDEIDLYMDVGKEFEEIKVIFDLDSTVPFITQVHDRMTIADHAVQVYSEFVKNPLDKEDSDG